MEKRLKQSNSAIPLQLQNASDAGYEGLSHFISLNSFQRLKLQT